MLWIGSVVPCEAGRLGQLLTAVQSNCGCAISGVSLTTSLGSVQPLRVSDSVRLGWRGIAVVGTAPDRCACCCSCRIGKVS
jgi:hypothetical protein